LIFTSLASQLLGAETNESITTGSVFTTTFFQKNLLRSVVRNVKNQLFWRIGTGKSGTDGDILKILTDLISTHQMLSFTVKMMF
jgi:hypothetical protein